MSINPEMPRIATEEPAGALRWLLEDVAALIALTLFLATLAVWASIIGAAS